MRGQNRLADANNARSGPFIRLLVQCKTRDIMIEEVSELAIINDDFIIGMGSAGMTLRIQNYILRFPWGTAVGLLTGTTRYED